MSAFDHIADRALDRERSYYREEGWEEDAEVVDDPDPRTWKSDYVANIDLWVFGDPQESSLAWIACDDELVVDLEDVDADAGPLHFLCQGCLGEVREGNIVEWGEDGEHPVCVDCSTEDDSNE